jgi:protocatechuate 4,5-dioxygenase beta chain
MGRIVAVFAASHAPGQTGFPEVAGQDKKEAVYRAWMDLKSRFKKARPDVLVGISNDHFQNFHRVQPPFCVGIGEEHVFPREEQSKFLRLKPHAVKGHVPLATLLLQTAADGGMDLAYSEELKFQDEFSVPKHFLDPADEIPFVPILTNCLNRNPPQPRRFYELGRVIAKTVESYPTGERVAVIGTGGLSHDPFGPNWCIIDETFDRRFLDLIVEDDKEALFAEFTLERIVKPGVGGTPEILNWFAALGAVPHGSRATVVAYEPVPQWATGMGYVAWNIAS